MARAFRRKGDHFVARLDEGEREVLIGLFEQTRDFLAPVRREPTGDVFEDLVASLGLPSLEDPRGAGAAADPGPRDPALDRLLPAAHREDAGIAAEYRRLTEHGLRERKSANLDMGIAALLAAKGDKVRLDREQAQAVVVALTDVRLLLGERLGLRTDEDADQLAERLAQGFATGDDDGEETRQEADPMLYLAAYYDFLTWLQESLTQALMS